MTTIAAKPIFNDWINANDYYDVPVGVEVIIQNRGRAGDVVDVFISDSQPLVTDGGLMMRNTDIPARVQSQSPVWLRYTRLDLTGTNTPSDARSCPVLFNPTRELQLMSSVNQSMIGGNQALTTQSFPELNSKRGNQYETVIRFDSITNVAPVYFGFETGDKPVIVKQRDIYGGFVDANYEVFSGASYTGGDTINAFNNNDLVINPTGVSIVSNPVVTVDGAVFGPVSPLLGNEGVGNRILTSYGDAAGEKILKPNTKYLVKITNLLPGVIGSLVVRIYYYEGPLSTQE